MAGQLLFKANGVGKTYGLNTVLRDIDMEIYSGEVIGLIGENGAGKSTLMKLIAGVTKPSMGSMELQGQPYSVNSILEANKHGIGMVFQEQSLVANLTISQNIYLGREKKYATLGFVNWAKMNADAKKALERIGIDLDVTKKVRDIDFAMRQMVEIAKVLDVVTETANGHAIILLDEPTTVLSDDEIKALFEQVRKMKEAGNAVIFISHDSADVWANQSLFDLNPDGTSKTVAGVPPDYFSATGQLWGNPQYNWQAMEKENYDWWNYKYGRYDPNDNDYHLV